MSYSSDLQRANASIEKFKDRITEHIKGELVSIEMEDAQIAKWFDIYSGIDALHKMNGQMRGVAIRCQWRDPKWRDYPFDTFTIRYSRATGTKTEYEKRMEAIFGGMGYIYPYLTIQAYFDDKENPNEILSFSIVKTADLYRFVSNHIDDRTKVGRKPVYDGNEFLYVDFSKLVDAGCKIITWRKGGDAIRQVGSVILQPTPLRREPDGDVIWA